jgi:four helix bundle protein
MRDFRKYEVWQLAIDFATDIYAVANRLPVFEKYALSSQLCRAAISISSNIAEGAARSSEIEFCRFLEIALGSSFEIETQLIIANRLDYIDATIFNELLQQTQIIERKINQLIQTIKKPIANS